MGAAVATSSEAVAGAGPQLALLRDHLRRLRAAYDHPNRTLHFDGVLAALLAGFHNPVVRSLRTLADASCGESFAAAAGVACGPVRRSTLSDALAAMDPAHLLPVVASLARRLPALRRHDDDLHALLRTIVAADGSVFTVPADVLWAIALTRSDGKVGRQVRLNLQLDVLRFVPTAFSVSGAGDGSESAAFMRDLAPGVVYVCDRNFVDFKFVHAVFAAGSDLVVRLKADTTFVATVENAVTDADRAANVVSDRTGRVPGSAGSPGFGDRPLREVVLTDPRSGRPVRLLTNLLDLPARTIGLIYRHRWMIELFFRWLKCVARVRRLYSHSPHGMTTEFYVAVIAVLLAYLRTGGRGPSVYATNCLAAVAAGGTSTATMLRVLERRERERMLERARLARKRAVQKTAG